MHHPLNPLSSLRPWLQAVLGCALATAAASSFAVLPPQYLGVKSFQKCLTTEPQGTAKAWCTPARKPATCPKASWKQLGALKGADQVPSCGWHQPPA